MCVHVVTAMSAASYFDMPTAVVSVIFIAVLFPVSCCLSSLVQMPSRVARTVAVVQPLLVDINERFRSIGFDFSLMERKEYSRRYLARPKASQLSAGYMLVVRRLASHDCGMGGPVGQDFASEVPGEWTDRPRQQTTRRKV